MQAAGENVENVEFCQVTAKLAPSARAKVRPRVRSKSVGRPCAQHSQQVERLVCYGQATGVWSGPFGKNQDRGSHPKHPT